MCHILNNVVCLWDSLYHCWLLHRLPHSVLFQEINPEYPLEGLVLKKLKLQYFGHQMGRADSLEKSLILGKIEGKRRRRRQRMRWLDGISGWNRHEFEQTPGDSEDGEARRAAVHGVTKSRTQLSDWTTTNLLISTPSPTLDLTSGEVSGLPTLPHHYFPHPLCWGPGTRTVVSPPNLTPWVKNGVWWPWGARPGGLWWLRGVVVASMNPVR